MRSFLLYAVLRLGLWALIWWLLTLAHVGVLLAGVLAAFLAMLLSILFLERFRSAAALRWKAADERRAERRGPVVDEDADYEDSVLDAGEPAEGPASLPELGGEDEDGANEPGADAGGLDEGGADEGGPAAGRDLRG